MKQTNHYHPNIILSPSVTLAEKLKEMGITLETFAKRIGVEQAFAVGLLSGEVAITQALAYQLEEVTQIPQEFWLSKQARYEGYKKQKS